MANENLGPAERVIGSLTSYSDHVHHGRPGIVTPDARLPVGVRWEAATYKVEGDDKQKVAYRLVKNGKKNTQVRAGIIGDDGKVRENGTVVGEYRQPGLFPEVATWMYRQVAEVWKLDNEFAAKWASYAFGQEHRDMKVVLAAFMLVQSRKGDPVMENGAVAFRDEDYRDVGEAMVLIRKKGDKDPVVKHLIRIYDLLSLPGVAAINRELGFGKSARKPFHGRWSKAVEKYLRHLEENPKLLAEVVKTGLKRTVRNLCQMSGHKPESPKFFEALSWKQAQAKDGRRSMAIDQRWKVMETWEGQSEEEICKRIVGTKPSWKIIVCKVPSSVGITRAIMASAIEAGCLSNKDLVIATPTLEDLGLLQVQGVRERWEKAVREAEDMRAMNVARNVKTKEIADKLQDAADNALKKAVEEATRDMEVFFFVDCSGSMSASIGIAKTYLTKFVQGFPLDRIHVATFNQVGREVQVKHASAAGVENAFRGITAGGGTSHAHGVMSLSMYKPKDGIDAVYFFVGDEGENNTFRHVFPALGYVPVAFGFIKLPGDPGNAIQRTAMELGIPCFMVNEATFSDPYAIPRTIRNMMAAAPARMQTAVTVPTRKSLIDIVLATPILAKPPWAIAGMRPVAA